MKNLSTKYKVIVLFLTSIVGVLSIIAIFLSSQGSPDDTKSPDADQQTTPKENDDHLYRKLGETGGNAEPTEQSLALSGWDDKDADGTSLAKKLPIDDQKILIAALLNDYTAHYSVSETMISGKIIDLSNYKLSPLYSFDVQFEKAKYHVVIVSSANSSIVNIKDVAGDRDVEFKK